MPALKCSRGATKRAEITSNLLISQASKRSYGGFHNHDLPALRYRRAGCLRTFDHLGPQCAHPTLVSICARQLNCCEQACFGPNSGRSQRPLIVSAKCQKRTSACRTTATVRPISNGEGASFGAAIALRFMSSRFLCRDQFRSMCRRRY
jgi:hypothetical protein